MRRVFLIMLACGMVLFSSHAVHFEPLSIEELAAEAQLVARGTVLRRVCQEDAQGRLYTRVELQVHELWKGRWEQPILPLVHGGGVLGEKRVQASGQADYAIGEEVVVFVIFNTRGEAVTIGLCQGKFRIVRPENGAEPQAGNGFVHRVTGEKAAALMDRAAAPRAWVPLTELKQRVTAQEVRR